jgi:hypothetical protein
MRALVVWLVILGLVLSPVVAQASSEGEKEAAAAKKPDAKPEAAKKADEKNEKSKTEEAPKPTSSIEIEIQQLRELIQAQAQELAALRENQAKTEARLKELSAVRPATQPGSGTAMAASSPAGVTPVADLLAVAKPGSQAAQEKKEDEPAAIKYKGVTLTPGGFFAAETVWRQRGLVADDNTPFNTVPFAGSSQANLSEFNAGGRQSRITMLVQGNAGALSMTGFYEADFLGAGTTSNNNQSNSYVYRQRQAWAQAALDNGWTFTGGQMWSLVTETRTGMNNRTEAVPMVIDHQYNVGFSWARQYGFRVTKNFHDKKIWLGMSVEGAQANVTFHTAGGFANTPFLIAAAGVGGGLYNNQANYSFNTTPDFVFKAVFEPGWGHYEVFGLVKVDRARIFPCGLASVAVPCPVNASTAPSAASAFNDKRTGGGFGANLRFPLVKSKKAEVGFHFFGGDGIGRYGTGGLPAATIRQDPTVTSASVPRNGTLSLLHNYQGLGTLELKPHAKLDIYFNFGAEYSARAAYQNAAGTGAIGYGSPLFSNAGCATETLPGNQNTPGSLGSCTGDTKALFEGTGGFWYRFYKGSKGTLQYGMQYSYVRRTTWTGASSTSGVGVAPQGTENMFFTSFRYVLP